MDGSQHFFASTEFDRLCHRPISPNHRMVERRDQIFGDDLRMIEHVLDRPHRRTGDALAESPMTYPNDRLESP
jgi:hypothetical protein